MDIRDKSNISYRDMVIGSYTGEVEARDDSEEEYYDTQMNFLDLENLKVEDHMDVGYICPKIIFYEHEEWRIHRPW